MSVVLGEDFADICVTLWGRDWKVRAAARLGRSERQLLNIETGVSNVSGRLRLELLQVVREQKKLLDAHEQTLS